jgi:hypothetical protein
LIKNLVLVEGKEDVNELQKTITSETKVICFDFEAHESLVNLNIKHDKVEKYFSDKDEIEIESKVVELTRQWYKHDKIKKNIEYNEINLGSLLEIELVGYFFEYVKRIMGIIRIFEKEKPAKVFVSFLGDCADIISKDLEIKLIKYDSKKTASLFFDFVEIPIKIGSKIIPIKISRKNFLRFKKIISKIINLIYNNKPKISQLKLKKSILLLDYNIMSYEELIKKLSNSKHNVLLLNQRRPVIWNFLSLRILKNSKCKILELNDFLNETLKMKIQKDQEKLKKELDSLWKKDEVFNEIFSIEGYSFWNAIKKNFSILTTKRFVESIERYILMDKLFDLVNVSVILEWAHVGLEDKLIISIANKKKIPNMFLQHGLYLQNEKFDEYMPIFPIIPSNGSKHLVWGEIMEKHIIEHGGMKEEIIQIGSPRYDKVFQKKKKKKKSNIVLLAANGFFHINCKGTDVEAFIKMENFVKKIFEVIKKYPDKKMIIKLHPGHVSFDIKPLIQKIDPSIEIYQNENILELLEKSDVMISLNYSTVVLDAMILEKPVLVLLPEDQNFENEIPLKNKTVLMTSDLNKLEILIKDLFENEKIRQELIQKGNEFVNQYIVNQGTSSEKLAEILEKY